MIDNSNAGTGLRCLPHVGGGWVPAEAPTGVTGDAWQHVACTYDGAAAGAWIDGRQVGTTQMFGALSSTQNDPIAIGASSDGTNTQNNFTGALDDVRIYRRALSAAELAALATQ